MNNLGQKLPKFGYKTHNKTQIKHVNKTLTFYKLLYFRGLRNLEIKM